MRIESLSQNKRVWWVAVSLILFGYFTLTLPFSFERPYGGDRIGQTAGIIRIYCQDPSQSILKGPHIHYGKNPFNLELTVFEWLQGSLARAFDWVAGNYTSAGPKCDSVEPVAKFFSILFGGLAVLVAAFLSAELWGRGAGIFTAFLLAFDSLWLRYSTYTMIENRALTIGMLAVLFSLKRKPILSFLFWSLTLLQKPQTYAVMAPFWSTAEAVRFWTKEKTWRVWEWFKARRNIADFKNILIAFSLAFIVGVVHFIWSSKINEASDLPWIQWMGPRSRKWFLGNISDRFTFYYGKSQILEWLRRSALAIVLPTILIIAALGRVLSRKMPFDLKRVVRDEFFIALPLLVASLAYTFVFYAVYVVHEYYSLPMNVGMALTSGAVLYTFLRLVTEKVRVRWVHALALCVVIVALLTPFGKGLTHMAWYKKEIHDTSSPHYLHDWDVQVFPKEKSFVVMAMLGNGRELFHLYMTKQRGFAWCARNPVSAPRKFWKEQGVEYVAWAKGVNPRTKRVDWEVRTIEEELKLARKNGWSSDVSDVWAGKSMAEWAALGSRTGRDPCMRESDFDPRKW